MTRASSAHSKLLSSHYEVEPKCSKFVKDDGDVGISINGTRQWSKLIVRSATNMPISHHQQPTINTFESPSLSLGSPQHLTMIWFQIFPDGPECEVRANRKTFAPPDLSLKDLRNAIPQHLFERSTLKSALYISVHVFLTVLLYVCAERIPLILDQLSKTCNHPKVIHNLVQPILWVLYWGWQGMFFAGIWCLGQFQKLVPRLFFWRKIISGHEARCTSLSFHKSDANLFLRPDMTLFLQHVGSIPCSGCHFIHLFWLHTIPGEQPIGHTM